MKKKPSEQRHKELEIIIGPRGDILYVYSDELAELFDGHVDTKRIRPAGQVRVTRAGLWQADLRQCGGPLLPARATRREAEAAKDAWLQDHLVELAEREEFWREPGRPPKHPTAQAKKDAKRAQDATSQRDRRALQYYDAAWKRYVTETAGVTDPACLRKAAFAIAEEAFSRETPATKEGKRLFWQQVNQWLAEAHLGCTTLKTCTTYHRPTRTVRKNSF